MDPISQTILTLICMVVAYLWGSFTGEKNGMIEILSIMREQLRMLDCYYDLDSRTIYFTDSDDVRYELSEISNAFHSKK